MFNFPYREKLSTSEESDAEDGASLLPGGEGENLYKSPTSRVSTRQVLALVATHILVLAIGVLVAAEYGSFRSRYSILRIQNYSPFVKDVGVKYGPVLFNGSFTQETIYRQDARPEVDAAWEALGVSYRPVAIPVEEAEKTGLAPDQVKISAKYGGGYPANVEGLHHLHCLNLLRKALYFNIEYYKELGEGAFLNEDHIVKLHVTHCLDIIRQQLMCTADVGVLGQVWWNPEEPHAFTDFNTKHMCRNFEDIRKWAEARQLPEHPPEDFLEPPHDDDRVYDEVP